jgi:1,4-alpha-glucan branching enzyme
VPGAAAGQAYAYVVEHAGQTTRKADPRARRVDGSRGNSILVDPAAFAWKTANFVPAPADRMIVYELHLGSFNPTTPGKPGTWSDAIAKLDYLQTLGVTTLEVMPPMEFTGDYSWGYNPAFQFAPETAYGTDDDARRFVDEAHARGMGVVIDVVHNHWGPQDLPMKCFDGDCLGASGAYFYTSSLIQTPWGPRPDYTRPEVRAYIEDSARMWLSEYRMDGMRWDSVGNIRAVQGGTPIPEGWELLKDTMDTLHTLPNKWMVAEDLYTVDAITKPTNQNGGGFDAQWDAAFFHPLDDTCTASSDAARSMASVASAIKHTYNGKPLQRVVYTEDHDEVANGRARIPEMISPGNAGSLVARKISSIGAVTVMASPGVPMLFMGQEFLQDGSFSDHSPLDWTRATMYAGVLALYTDLVALRRNAAQTTLGLTGDKVEVFHVNDAQKVIAWHRWKQGGAGDDVVVVVNWSGTSFATYEVGFPLPGAWHVRFRSDDPKYGADLGGPTPADVTTKSALKDGFSQSALVALTPYSAVVLSQ